MSEYEKLRRTRSEACEAAKFITTFFIPVYGDIKMMRDLKNSDLETKICYGLGPIFAKYLFAAIIVDTYFYNIM